MAKSIEPYVKEWFVRTMSENHTEYKTEHDSYKIAAKNPDASIGAFRRSSVTAVISMKKY